MNVIPHKHTSGEMWFTNLLITSLAKWSDISHMEKSLTFNFLISCLTTFINWATLCSGQWNNTFISHAMVPRCKNVKDWGKIEINLTIMRKFKYVLSTMGVSKESISKFLIGNRFHVKLRTLSPENYKQSLQVKSCCYFSLSAFHL